MKKRFLSSILALSLLGLTACGQSQTSSDVKEQPTGSAEKVINLKSADTVAATSPYTVGMNEFSELLAKETNGKIQLKHFPAGQLGNDIEVAEGVKMGSIDLAMIGNVQTKATDAFYLPFLFEDSEHWHAVLDGEIGEKIKQKIEEQSGLKLIGYVYFAPRIMTTKGKEIKTPEDLKGLKIRVPEIPLMVDTWKALGATPTPIVFGELFSALQTGIVDAQENPYEIAVNNSFFEVQDTIIETNHSIPVRFLVMNKKKYESLTPEEQGILQKNWDATALKIESLYKENEAEYIQTLKDKGMKFVQPDVNAFREATKDVWKKYAPEAWGEGVYEEIEALRKNK
ncbi:TRAP transporter substrate-binding protein [Ammoniphilus sp. 3BR4]|uniref:TRAP transporter substrate-binding protein n=1 Tax=Ammoniphilus sp. 3BR4 TaxID=3158265 RepID=UPI003467CB26